MVTIFWIYKKSVSGRIVTFLMSAKLGKKHFDKDDQNNHHYSTDNIVSTIYN